MSKITLSLIATTSVLMMSGAALSQEAYSSWYYSVDIGPSGFVMVPDSLINTLDTEIVAPGLITIDPVTLSDGTVFDIEAAALSGVIPVAVTTAIVGGATFITGTGITGTVAPMAAAAGVNGSASICMDGVSTADWLDLCGGVTAFIGGTGSQTITEGGTSVTVESSVQSVGAFMQAKAQLGLLTFAPSVGVRQVFAQTKASTDLTIEGLTLPVEFSYSGSETVVFAGLETGFSILDGMGEIGIKGEVGRGVGTTAGNEFFTGSATLYGRVNF